MLGDFVVRAAELGASLASSPRRAFASPDRARGRWRLPSGIAAAAHKKSEIDQPPTTSSPPVPSCPQFSTLFSLTSPQERSGRHQFTGALNIIRSKIGVETSSPTPFTWRHLCLTATNPGRRHFQSSIPAETRGKMSGGCPYASPPLPSPPQLLYKCSLPPTDFRKPSHHLSSPTLQQVSSLSSTPPPPRLRPHPARDGPRGAPQDRLREVQDRGLRPEAGSLRAPQGPPVTQVHGVCVRRLARVPVGDPGPGAWRGLHRPQHRCHGPVLLQEQAHRCRVGHRVRRLRPQGRGHRGDRPQPLRRDQGPPQPQGWRRRHLPLRRGLGQDRVPGQEEGQGRVRRDAFRGPVRRLGKGSRQRVPPEPEHLPVRQGGLGQRNPQAGRRPLRLRHRQVRHMGAVN